VGEQAPPHKKKIDKTMNTVSEFFDAWEFFRSAALSGAIAGALLGALGTYILLKRMVFLSAALSQISAAGIALGFLIQAIFLNAAAHHDHGLAPDDTFCLHDLLLSPVVSASVLSILTLIIVNRCSQKVRTNDAIIAFVYLVGTAATLLIGTHIVAEIQDIQQLLVGNAVIVSNEDFHGLILLAIPILFLHIILRRGFESAAFFPESSRIAAIPVKTLNLLLLLSLALAIAYTTRLLGALPVFALSVLPAMAARPLARNIHSMFYIAALIGALSGFFGYLAAFVCNFPVGPTQAAVAALCLPLAYAARTAIQVTRRHTTPANKFTPQRRISP